MAYHVVDPTALDQLDDRDASVQSISHHVGLETLGLRVYRADPGEQLPLAFHYHDEQEEAFYVLAGELHVETPNEEFAVPAGQLFVVEPGNPHRAFNPASAADAVEVLAMGAPSVDDVHAYDG
jgi:mannose-6-phosphate isomerase-like protein (cupin superfamily)